MLRLLGVLLAGAVVLGVGPPEDQRLSKEKYIAVVESTIESPKADRLFDEVIDFQLMCGHFCSTDAQTAAGEDWLRAERSLYEENQRIADRLAHIYPPREVAAIHAAWVSSIRGCVERLRGLEPAAPRIDNITMNYEFQKRQVRAVARTCLDRQREICDQLYEKGYSFD